MNPNVIRIVAAIVDTTHLKLYKENGEEVNIPQGDPRVRKILEVAVPLLAPGGQGYADVDISGDNQYLEFEQSSNGVVKIFRIAKDKLKALFDMGVAEEVKEAPIEPLNIGAVPTSVKQTMSAVNEILQHAIPVSHTSFNEDGLDQQRNVVEEDGYTLKDTADGQSPDTLIAVVDGKVIPGVEKIKTQFVRATKLGSTKGVEAFLKRLGAVIEQRKHSIEDLLKFMERGDLPIAEDGSILIYKVLKTKGKAEGKQVFVDCHSGKVEQWVGAYVCMNAKLVDHDRRNECSNGLHVARRGYVSGFSGDVCVLAKLAPEDVIAVPEYDANKMRVCGYHIIMELTSVEYGLLKQNKPITDCVSGKTKLAMAMNGQHIRKTHEVKIHGNKGADVKVTEIKEVTSSKKQVAKHTEVEALGNPDAETKDVPVDPKAVVKYIQQVSRKDQAQLYWADYQAGEEGALEALKAFKKASKVSWNKLGIPDPEMLPKPVLMAPKGISPKLINDAAKATEIYGDDALEQYHDEQLMKDSVNGSSKERIQKLLAIGLTKDIATKVREIKKQAKKSWEVLGVDEVTVEKINRLVGL
jgi:hypothetical protein